MEVVIGKYMAKPYSNGLCWQLFKRCVSASGNKQFGVGPGEEFWKSLDRYPSTLLGCIETISNFMLMDGEAQCDLDAAVSEVKRVMDEVARACAEIDPKSKAELAWREAAKDES